MSASSLKSFAPEICSLICQDPTLARRDLNSICFISHAFRKEAQRILSYRFPCLRSTSRVKAWCMSLKRRPHLSKNVQELVLFLPPQGDFHTDDVAHLVRALQMCVNLKELTILSQLRKHGLQGQWTSAFILDNLPFRLTKFVNGYFIQDQRFRAFLQSQQMLEILEVHWVFERCLCLPYLKTLSWPATNIGPGYYFPWSNFPSLQRLRVNFENWTERSDYLGNIIGRNKELKSLAIFLDRKPGEQKCYHFLQIMRAITKIGLRVKHLQIHQFQFLFEERAARPEPICLSGLETLVVRPAPSLPSDDPNHWGLVNLQTTCSRRKTAEDLVKISPELTRLVLMDHEYDYEFRRDPQTGIIAEEELITLDEREWAWIE